MGGGGLQKIFFGPSGFSSSRNNGGGEEGVLPWIRHCSNNNSNARFHFSLSPSPYDTWDICGGGNPRCYSDISIPVFWASLILKTLVIWASPLHITLAIWVRVTGDTHITGVLGMGMPKTRWFPYHFDTGLVTTEIDRFASKSRITKPSNNNSLLLANTMLWFSLDYKRQSLQRRRKKLEKVVIPSIEVMTPPTKS